MAEKADSKTISPVVQLVLMALVAIVASAGSGVVSYVLISKNLVAPVTDAEEGEEAEKIRELMENGAVIGLEPFVVNLADAEPRYLRITISLMVDGKEGIEHLVANSTMVSKTRDVILQTLSRKTSAEVRDDAGKDLLRTEILERLSPYFVHPKIVDVMFTEFVIQL